MKSQLHRNDRSASVPSRAAGLTLVELLLAMTIGAVMIFGATQVYVDSRKAYAVNETTERLQENARYALSVLEPDIRMSGYWGLTNVSDGITGIAQPTDAQSALGAPAASTCGVNFPLLLGFPVQGTNDSYAATCAANSAAMPNADANKNLNAGAALTNLLNPPPAIPATTPAQIVAVRIWLLVRTDAPEAGFTDDRIYEYGDRLAANGTTGDLTNLADSTKAYQPSLSTDNSFTGVKHYRRLLVSKTIQIRNALAY